MSADDDTDGELPVTYEETASATDEAAAETTTESMCSRADDTQMPDLGYTWTPSDLDEEWEATAREKLDTVDADTDLGIELARASLRLARGEISQAVFNESFHEDVVAEFGEDARPTRQDAGPISYAADQEASQVAEDDERTAGDRPRVPDSRFRGVAARRNVLKSMGAAAAAGATAGLAGCLDGNAASTGAPPSAGEPDDVQMGMVIDTDECIACMLCAEACKHENDTDVGTHWMHVFRYEEDEYGDTEEDYLPRPCQHCSEPSCSYVCPTQARFKRADDGLVLTNYDTCIGCKYCEVACPYGVNFLGRDEPNEEISSGFTGSETDEHGTAVGGPPPSGVMGKCTFCVHRQDNTAQRGTTACEDDCPVDAIHFGNMNDEDSAPRQYLREKRGENRWKLLDDLGTEPNVVYLGNEPSKDAKPVDGPYTYEDLGMKTRADGKEQAQHRGEDS